MFALYARFADLLDKHVADEIFVVALAATMSVVAKAIGLLP